MKTDKLLEELENIIVNSSHIPMTSKLVIEEEEVMHVLDSIKESLPLELEESRLIVQEKEKILADAQRQADTLIAQAKDYISKLTEESELVKEAQERAAIVMNEANQSSIELKNSSLTYADDVLKYVENNLEKALDSLRQNRESLNKPNVKR